MSTVSTTTSIELQGTSTGGLRTEDNTPINESQTPAQHFSLPPVDRGKDAWLCLAGCFMVEVMVWGFPFSFGVFQDYYSTHPPFSLEPSGIAAIGTTESGLMYLSGPLAIAAMIYWPNTRRQFCIYGVLIMSVALVASSFANTVWQLILTQGVLYGIGGSLLYFPSMFFIDEWFAQRKGLAFGIMWGGTGFSGTTFPYLLSWALETYSYRIALRMWAVVVLVSILPFLYFLRPRVPYTPLNPSEGQPRRRRLPLSFLKNRAFIIFNLGSVLEGLGYFIPGIFLPSYAQTIGITSRAQITATIAILNLSAVLGCIFIGLLVDRFHATTPILISSVGAMIAVFLFWGLTGLGSNPLALLLVFSIFYGFFAGSFTTSWTGVTKAVQASDTNSDGEPGATAGMIFGFLSMGRGIGAVCAGPISEALLSRSRTANHSGSKSPGIGYESEYGPLIVITGVTAGLGSLSWGARRLGWI